MSVSGVSYKRSSSSSNISVSTVSSYEIKDDISQERSSNLRLDDTYHGTSNAFSRPLEYHLNACNDISISENVTNVYQDNKTSNFNMSDPNIPLKTKVLHVLSQRWCWGLMFTCILITSVTNTLIIFLKPRYTYNYYGRDVWGAKPAEPGIPPLKVPASRIILMHTADREESCLNFEQCSERLRNIQSEAMDYGLKDIPYNFLIGDDGNVYEGRGFRFQGETTSSQFGSSFDDIGINIAFIGTFKDRSPNNWQIETLSRFIESSIKEEHLIADYVLLLQDQLISNPIPALGIFEAIEKFDKFHEITRVFMRNEWNSSSPADPMKVIHFYNPLSSGIYVQFFSYCSNMTTCAEELRAEQGRNIISGCNDINANFLISEYSMIFEGRGWDARTEGTFEHRSLKSENKLENLVIGYISNASYPKPNSMFYEKAHLLARDGIMLGKLSSDFKFEDGIYNNVECCSSFYLARDDWGSKQSDELGIRALNVPSSRIIVMHTADLNETCLTREKCVDRIVSIMEMNSNLKDIPYNFLIGDDGNVYEGRGFMFEGETTSSRFGSYFDNIGISVAFIGTYRYQSPSQSQIEIFSKFINDAIRCEYLSANYMLLAQDQLISNAVPASGIFGPIKNFDKFKQS